jgi:uncharacterized protein YacL
MPEGRRRSAPDSDPSNARGPGQGVGASDAAQTSVAGRETWTLRALLVVCSAALSYASGPFGLRGVAAAGPGFLVALAIVLAELRLRRAALSGLVGGAIGTLAGLLAALLFTLVISRIAVPEAAKSFVEYVALIVFAYLGLMLGASRGKDMRVPEWSAGHETEDHPSEVLKLLDTSVLIDGRIAEICEAHFLDGVLAVPQFVLHELQLVADSSDSLKRQRGRRGLEVLQRMQKMPHVEVRILDDDSAQTGDVDHKLVELARKTGAKIVTNDFNLNKVAKVHGLAVLNVNQLANALKPAVLPGEPMRVMILREGKEPNQGVAYLDDGTMVVVDGARRMINKSTDIIVTSVHQTTAGKMIFGRLDERSEALATPARQAAIAGRGESGSRTDSSTRLAETPAAERGTRPIFPGPEDE